MKCINKVVLLGNATRDAVLRHTDGGKAVSSIRLATNRRAGAAEETQYHTVVCWDGLAETTSRHVKKGNLLYVEGRLQYRSFQDEEGRERGVAEIIASEVIFLSPPSPPRRPMDKPRAAARDEGETRVPYDTIP